MSKKKTSKNKKIKKGSIEETQSKKRNRKKEKNRRFTCKIYVCVFIGLLALEEYVWSGLSEMILKYILPGAAVITLLVGILTGMITFNNKDAQKILRLRKPGTEEIADIWKVVENILLFFRRATFLHLILGLISLLFFRLRLQVMS